MKRYYLTIICFLVAAAFRYEAEAQEIGKHIWHPTTNKLDEAAKYADPVTKDAATTLAHDVKAFYQLLHDKQWHKTYELRAKAFREDCPEPPYLAEAKLYEKRWGLVNYDVLSVEVRNSIGSTNFDEATLICKFTELPDYAVSYSTVFWHKEDGVWKCLSAGPFKLSIFRATRPPIIDWR